MGVIRWVPTRVLDLVAGSKPKPVRKWSGSAYRVGWPILGYIGANGSGKSLAAARDTYYAMEVFDRPCLSNLRLMDEDGNDHPNWIPLERWQDLATFEHGEILLDEVQGVAGSRGYESLPPQVMSGFLQLRKRDVRLRWTTTTYARVDKALREVTAAIAICRSSHPDVREAEPGSPWVPRRRFLVSLLDVTAMESAEASLIATGGAASNLVDSEELTKALHVERRWRRSGDPRIYETLGMLSTMNHTDASGLCMDCGGKKKVQACSCGQDHREGRQGRSRPEPAPLEPSALLVDLAVTMGEPEAVTSGSREERSDLALWTAS